MNEKKTSVVNMDGLCKAGCIITIISAGLVMLVTLIWGILALTLKLKTVNPDLIPTNEYLKVSGWMLIIIGLIQLLPLLFSINLLRGKASSKIPAGVIALIFSGLLGGILILVGKYEVGNTTVVIKEQQSID